MRRYRRVRDLGCIRASPLRRLLGREMDELGGLMVMGDSASAAATAPLCFPIVNWPEDDFTATVAMSDEALQNMGRHKETEDSDYFVGERGREREKVRAPEDKQK